MRPSESTPKTPAHSTTQEMSRARIRRVTLVYTLYAIGSASAGVALSPRPVAALAWFAAGVGAWTFFEYAFHRWVQHHRPMPEWYHRYDDHAAHHADPDDPEGHVFALPYTLPIALPMAISSALAGPSAIAAVAGWLLGYTLYECVHYASHVEPLRAGRPWLARWAENHRRRHWERGNAYYGFVTTFWDRLLGTYPPPR